jgi:uncharacterized protein (DUF58 family)
VTHTARQAWAETGSTLTIRGHAFVASGLTLLIGGLLLGFTDITRIGVLLSALPLLAAVNARRQRSSISAIRTVRPARLVTDQSTSVTIVLKNTSSRRTKLQLAEERVHNLLGDGPRFFLPALGPGEIREVAYQIRSQVRGRYQLGPLTLHRQDPYGLASVALLLPGFTDILVLPRIEFLGRGRPRTNDIGTEGAIPHLTALHGEDDVAVRSFRDGDDLRRIHWPSTAHRSKLMVRQEDPPARRRAMIVLDSRACGHQGSGTSGSFEWAVSATASIAAHLSAHRYKLHLASIETAAAGQPTQVVELDDALASLAMAEVGTSRDFDEVLSWAHPLAATRGLVIAIVTDHDEAALQRTAALRRPEGTGLLILLDTASFAGPQLPAPTERTLTLAEMVRAAGWSTCVVSSGTGVAQAWDVIASHSGVMVGTGR